MSTGALSRHRALDTAPEYNRIVRTAARFVSRRLVLALLLCWSTGAACSRSPAPQAGGPVVVAVTAARIETLRDSLTAAGTVVPATSADWIVTAMENARIAELPHAEGETVQAGDLLVRFDIPSIAEDLAARQTDVAQATARLDAAKRELAKISGLSDQGLIPRNQLDSTKSAVVDAQIALTAAQAQLDRTTIASARAKIMAKFAGTIVKRWHQEGDAVIASEADPILRVVDPTRLQVAVTLSIAELNRVMPGQPATVVVPGGPSEAATVTVRPTPTSGATTSVDIRLSFAQPTTLAADTPVEVEIQLDQRPDAIVVPRLAVQKDDDSTYVMVAGDDGRAHRHDVRVGMTTRDLAQIISGVAFGDRVITTTPGQLIDGMAVHVEK